MTYEQLDLIADSYMPLLFFETVINYSTHMALALVFVVALSRKKGIPSFLLIGSMHGCCVLMLYQSYYTRGDILSTITVLLLSILLLQTHPGRRYKKQEVIHDS